MDLIRGELRRYRCALVRPLVTAAGTFTTREGVVLTLGDGHRVGRGEAAPLPGFSTESLDEAEEALRHWLASGRTELPDGPPSARHAAEQATLALRHGAHGVTRALGAEGSGEVPVNALVTDADDAARAVCQGHETLKLKVARALLDDDVRRIRAVRAAVGPEVQLRLDANRGWTHDEAVRALTALAPLGLEVVEEPCDGLQAMRSVRRATGVRVGADESVRSEADLDEVLATGGIDVVVLKPMLIGGLARSVAMLRRAHEAGVDTVVTTSIDGGVARHGALAVAAAGPASLACGLDTGRWLVDDPHADAGPVIAGGIAREPT